LRGLLTAPTPEGESCRLVTVVTGLAASAAADLLALGEYAIAFSYADIVYHGTRQQTRDPITYELAALLASSIKEYNELFAQRLAMKVFERIVFRASQFNQWLDEYRSNDLTKLDGFARELTNKLRPQNRHLLRRAYLWQAEIGGLVSSVDKHLDEFKKSLASSQSGSQARPQLVGQVLKAIVDYHLEENRTLSFGGIEAVISDFELLQDFYFGSHQENMVKIVLAFGELFLSADDRKRFLGSSDAQSKYTLLEAKAAPKLEPLWFLVISICRILQSDDFELKAEEAY